MITERILVVDDESTICDSVKKILSRKGFTVENSLNADDALEKMKTNKYDLLITDLMMPKISGLELIELVKKYYPEIDVLVITGFATIKSAVKATKLGALDFIQKPFTADELNQRVQKAIESRKNIIKREYKTEEINTENGNNLIDIDMPFIEREVEKATHKDYVNKLTRSDMTLPAKQSRTENNGKGNEERSSSATTGIKSKAEYPIVQKAKKQIPQSSELIDADMPFNLAEVEVSVGSKYLDCLDRSDWPRVALYGKNTETRHNILVVDDEPIVCHSLKRILNTQCCVVDEAFDSNIAEQKLRNKKYDLIFLDLKMPGKDGMEILLTIKANYPDTPVIMISGYGSVDKAVEATKFGAYQFIPKPFTPEEIKELALEVLV